MQLAQSEDEAMLARTARAYLGQHGVVARLRKLRDTRDELGYSPEFYRQMAELGWTAVPVAAADGGVGLGVASAALITEALARQLAPEPYLR